jgi:hypothetical protein
MIGLVVFASSIIAWPKAKIEATELKDAIRLIRFKNYSAVKI